MGRAAEDIATRFGRLDAVVANAGIKGVWAPVDDLTPDEWDTTIRVNLRGTYLALNKTVPLLKANGGGAIVVVSSINGVRTFTDPGATAYSATKAAQVAMTEQLALELGRHRGYRTLRATRRGRSSRGSCPPPNRAAARGTWRAYYEKWWMMTGEHLHSELVDLLPELRSLVPPARVFDKSAYSPWVDGRLDGQLQASASERWL
jgi:hypothetical protein